MKIKHIVTFTLDSMNEQHYQFLGGLLMVSAIADIDIDMDSEAVKDEPVDDKPKYTPYVPSSGFDAGHLVAEAVKMQKADEQARIAPRPPADWASTNDNLKTKWFDMSRFVRDGVLLSIDCPTCRQPAGHPCLTAGGDQYQVGYGHAARTAKAARKYFGYAEGVTAAARPTLTKKPPTNRHAYMRKVECSTCGALVGEPCHPRGSQNEHNKRPYDSFYHLDRIQRANNKWGEKRS